MRIAADGPAAIRPMQVTGSDEIVDLSSSVIAALLGQRPT
jgi:hypothetical protein